MVLAEAAAGSSSRVFEQLSRKVVALRGRLSEVLRLLICARYYISFGLGIRNHIMYHDCNVRFFLYVEIVFFGGRESA